MFVMVYCIFITCVGNTRFIIRFAINDFTFMMTNIVAAERSKADEPLLNISAHST